MERQLGTKLTESNIIIYTCMHTSLRGRCRSVVLLYACQFHHAFARLGGWHSWEGVGPPLSTSSLAFSSSGSWSSVSKSGNASLKIQNFKTKYSPETVNNENVIRYGYCCTSICDKENATLYSMWCVLWPNSALCCDSSVQIRFHSNMTCLTIIYSFILCVCVSVELVSIMWLLF